MQEWKWKRWGQTNCIVRLTYDGFGRVRTTTQPGGYTVTQDYDALDRPTQITYPDGTTEQFAYARGGEFR